MISTDLQYLPLKPTDGVDLVTMIMRTTIILVEKTVVATEKDIFKVRNVRLLAL